MTAPVLTITSREDAVELVLTNEHVRMKLSDAVMREFHRDVQADPDVQAPGLAGRFARMVVGAVGTLISSYIQYDLDDIESLTYQDGTLVFTYHRRHRPSFEDVKFSSDSDKTSGAKSALIPALAAFSPADAQAFVQQFAAVKAQTQR